MRGRKCKERTTTAGRILTERRLLLGYSQMQVSDLTGVNFRMWQRIEEGSVLFSRVRLREGLAVCTLLKINPYEILRNEGAASEE